MAMTHWRICPTTTTADRYADEGSGRSPEPGGARARVDVGLRVVPDARFSYLR